MPLISYCRTKSVSMYVDENEAHTMDASSPGGHSNCILSKEYLDDIDSTNLNPLLKQNINGHVHNKQRETNGGTYHPEEMNTTKMSPFVNICANISATKITMSSCHTG